MGFENGESDQTGCAQHTVSARPILQSWPERERLPENSGSSSVQSTMPLSLDAGKCDLSPGNVANRFMARLALTTKDMRSCTLAQSQHISMCRYCLQPWSHLSSWIISTTLKYCKPIAALIHVLVPEIMNVKGMRWSNYSSDSSHNREAYFLATLILSSFLTAYNPKCGSWPRLAAIWAG